MMKLYDLEASGNCYKVRLFASLANIELERVPVDFLSGAHKQPPLSELNPLGQLPILEDGKQVVRDSQAILVYLAGVYGGWHGGQRIRKAKPRSFSGSRLLPMKCSTAYVLHGWCRNLATTWINRRRLRKRW